MSNNLEADIQLKFDTFKKNYTKINVNATLDEIIDRQLPKIKNDNKTTKVISLVDKILSNEIEKKTFISIEELHTLIYCAAKTVTEFSETTYLQKNIPTEFPTDSNQQKQLLDNSPRIFVRLLLNKTPVISEETTQEQSTSKETTDLKQPPTCQEIEKFWGTDMWENEINFDRDSKYFQDEKRRISETLETVQLDQSVRITMQDLIKAFKSKKNWTPPGIDGIQNFWYKKFESIQTILLDKINNIIEMREEMPDFFTIGFTELHPKTDDISQASNYRPITHLPAIYKIITRCLYQKIFAHYTDHQILADEQCGGRKNCFGVRKAVIVDDVALNQERVYGKYVDIKKAFDSVSHKLIIEILKIYKVPTVLVNFLENTLSKWKTRIYLKPNIFTKLISLKRGVFQGDCTSVLLFWTAINPLSFALNRSNKGLKLSKGGCLSHILYMDDLKLYASNKNDLDDMFKEVKEFCRSIGMDVNDKKCHDFVIPSDTKSELLKKEQVYLGYPQSPKITSGYIIFHRVRQLENKFKKLNETAIDDDVKLNLKKKYLFNSIANTFGVIHWQAFKRELLTFSVKEKKFHTKIRPYCRDFENIYLKLISDMCTIRRSFYNENSKLAKIIIQNDTFTPLLLSETDEDEYIKKCVAKLNRKYKRKRKQKSKRKICPQQYN